MFGIFFGLFQSSEQLLLGVHQVLIVIICDWFSYASFCVNTVLFSLHHRSCVRKFSVRVGYAIVRASRSYNALVARYTSSETMARNSPRRRLVYPPAFLTLSPTHTSIIHFYPKSSSEPSTN